MGRSTGKDCWIGFHRFAEDLSVWKWIDGTPTDFGTDYSGGVAPWYANEPNNYGGYDWSNRVNLIGTEYCAEIYAQHEGQWNDIRCDWRNYAICNSPIEEAIDCSIIPSGEVCAVTTGCVWLPFSNPPRCGSIDKCEDNCAACTEEDCVSNGAGGNDACSYPTMHTSQGWLSKCMGNICHTNCEECQLKRDDYTECENSFAPGGCAVFYDEICMAKNPTPFPTQKPTSYINPTPEPTSRPTTSPTTYVPSSAPVMPTTWLPTPESTDAPTPGPAWHPVCAQITESYYSNMPLYYWYGWDDIHQCVAYNKKLFIAAFRETCVVRRECPECTGSHKVIYYKRIANDCHTFDAFDMLTNNWMRVSGSSADNNGIGNALNVDFLLTNSESVALDASIQSLEDCNGRCWSQCNYNDSYENDEGLQHGGFRECGYRELVGGKQFYCDDSETTETSPFVPSCKSVRWSVL